MAGLEIEGDGVSLFTLVIDESKNPKEIVSYAKVSGNTATGSNSVQLATIKTLVKTTKEKCDLYISQVGAVATQSSVIILED